MNYKILSFLLVITSCSSSHPASDNYSRVARSANVQIRNEMPVAVSGFGAMIPNQIHAYSMIFHLPNAISIEQGRDYVLRMVQIVLDKFNSDSSVQDYLENRPFALNNVCFSIFVNNWDEFEPPRNHISFISFSFGKITYEQYDTTKGELILLLSETYEEALQKCTASNCSISCE